MFGASWLAVAVSRCGLSRVAVFWAGAAVAGLQAFGFGVLWLRLVVRCLSSFEVAGCWVLRFGAFGFVGFVRIHMAAGCGVELPVWRTSRFRGVGFGVFLAQSRGFGVLGFGVAGFWFQGLWLRACESLWGFIAPSRGFELRVFRVAGFRLQGFRWLGFRLAAFRGFVAHCRGSWFEGLRRCRLLLQAAGFQGSGRVGFSVLWAYSPGWRG